MYKTRRGITFFSSRPHHVHAAFAESVNADTYLFRFDGKTKKPFIELIKSPFMPKPDSDVFICESPLYLFTVIPQKIFNPRLKVVLLATSPFRMYYDRQGPAGKYLLKKTLDYVDGVIAVSQYVADFYATLTDCPIKIAYPYANVEKYDGDYSEPGSKNICFLGKMMPYKGIDILIEAFRLIRNEVPGSRLYLMGHFKDESLKISEIEGLENIGNVDDPRLYFSHSSIYLHPARDEAFGVSIMEACAAGLIPIVSKNCGAAEILKIVSPELVVNSLDPECFARRAIEVMEWSPDKKLRVISGLKEIARNFKKDMRIWEFKVSFADLMIEIDERRKLKQG